MRAVLGSRLFFHPSRHEFAYRLLDEQLERVLRGEWGSSPRGELVLNVPSGAGRDLPLLRQLGGHVLAADINFASVDAARRLGSAAGAVQCDALHLPFRRESVSIILMDLFLHHVLEDGFDPYLTECWRVLGPGGALVIQELSSHYPLSWATLAVRRLLRRVFGYEFFGHVPHERPFPPARLVKSLREVGFMQVRTIGSSFVHNRFYVPIARIVAWAQGPLLHAPGIRSMAWNVIFVAHKA